LVGFALDLQTEPFSGKGLHTTRCPGRAAPPGRIVGLVLICNWGIGFGNLAQMVGNILKAETLVFEKKKTVNHLNC